jgi:hypothetical protein
VPQGNIWNELLFFFLWPRIQYLTVHTFDNPISEELSIGTRRLTAGVQEQAIEIDSVTMHVSSQERNGEGLIGIAEYFDSKRLPEGAKRKTMKNKLRTLRERYRRVITDECC